MAIANMTVRISGQMAYSDGSKDSFAVVYEDGQVKFEDRYGDAQTAFDQAWNDPTAQSLIKSCLAGLGGTHTFVNNKPSQIKTVKSIVFNYYGLIARKDQSKDKWSVHNDLKAGVVVSNASVYAEVRADSSALTILSALWLALIGSGTVSIK